MALFNSFQFGDVDSKDYGVYISGDSVYDSPARSVDLVQVPGRNGALALDNGYYENIEVTYPAGSFGTSQEEWREKMLGIRNALAAQRGYQRLIDTYHPEHYRLGMFFAGISASPVQYNRAGQFPIRFNCKPQRFLISGDTPVEFTAEGQEEVYGPSNIVSFEAEEGAEIRELKVNLEPIQDLNGYDNPWPAGGGKNLFEAEVSSSTYAGITATANGDGTFTFNGTATAQFDYYFTNNEQSLANGTYLINGITNGSNSTYRLYARIAGNTNRFVGINTGDAEVTLSNETIRMFLRIYNGATLNNVVIKPMIRLASVADATYAPYSNICPISGHTEVNVTRTGKNLIGSVNIIDGEGYNANGIPETNANRFRTLPIKCEGKSYITISWTIGTVSSQAIRCIWDANGNLLNRTVPSSTTTGNRRYYTTNLTSFSGACYIAFAWYADGGASAQDNATDVMAEFSDSMSDYETGEVATYPISLGQTVYGGTLNVTTGVLTMDRAITTMSTLSWIAGTASGRTYFKAAVAGKVVPTSSDTTHPIVATNINYAGVLTVAQMPDVSLAQAPGNTEVRIYDSAVTTLSEMQDKYGTGQFVYYLATPITVQLTPTQVSTLLGANNIWSDSGSVEVKVASPVDLTNPTNFPAKPLIRIYGNGSVRVGDTIATVQNNADGYVDIDCESMNCYDTTGGRNADVSFSGNDFPELASGNNGILLTGPSKVEITPRWWEL